MTKRKPLKNFSFWLGLTVGAVSMGSAWFAITIYGVVT